MRLRPELSRGPRYGSLQRSPNSLAGFENGTEWARKGEEKEERGKRKRERKNREGKVKPLPSENFGYSVDA